MSASEKGVAMGITQSTRSFAARRAKKRSTEIRYVGRSSPRVNGHNNKRSRRVSAPLGGMDSYVERGAI